ncbi:MAG: phytanoyl-CoA dioxygenase family protein [Novosphingobium sp.]
MAALELSAQFARQGYLILPGALPAAPCEAFGAQVLAEYGRLNQAGEISGMIGSLAGNLNIRMGEQGRQLLADVEAAGIAALAEELAGAPVALRQAVGNLNLPGSCLQDFHLDGAFANRLIIANVCLTPTSQANGATELIPQSDREDLSYWRLWREGWRSRAIGPALNPGDVLIRPSNLWHRGTPNRSSTPRPMAGFIWGPLAQGEAATPCPDLEGPLTLFANKYYGRFARAKEFTAARLPWLDEALRLGQSFLRDRK